MAFSEWAGPYVVPMVSYVKRRLIKYIVPRTVATEIRILVRSSMSVAKTRDEMLTSSGLRLCKIARIRVTAILYS